MSFCYAIGITYRSYSETEYWQHDDSTENVGINSQPQSQSQPRPRPRPRPAVAPPRASVSASPPPAGASVRKRVTQRRQQNSDSEDEIAFVPTQRSKGKAAVKGRGTKNIPEYYPESEDAVSEQEMARPPPRRTRGKALPIVDEDDGEDFGDAIAAIPDADDSPDEGSTMKSSGASRKGTKARAPSVPTRRSESVAPSSVSRSQATGRTATRKRDRADSDSDDGVAFKGFAGGKKRAKR